MTIDRCRDRQPAFASFRKGKVEDPTRIVLHLEIAEKTLRRGCPHATLVIHLHFGRLHPTSGGMPRLCAAPPQSNYLERFAYALRVLGRAPAFTIVIVMTPGVKHWSEQRDLWWWKACRCGFTAVRPSDRLMRVFPERCSRNFSLNPNDFRDFRAQPHV